MRVFRLITVQSVEGQILETATKKLNLERLVIHRGTFRGDSTSAAGSKKLSITAQALLNMLLHEEEHRDGETTREQPISDEDLMALLSDRSEGESNPPLTRGTGFKLVDYENIDSEEIRFHNKS